MPHIIIPEYVYSGSITGYRTLSFWDHCFRFLLTRLDTEFPEWTESTKVKSALGDMGLMVSGKAATSSLAVSWCLSPCRFGLLLTCRAQAWRKLAERRGDLAEEGARKAGARKAGVARSLFGAVRRKLTWRKIFNF